MLKIVLSVVIAATMFLLLRAEFTSEQNFEFNEGLSNTLPEPQQSIKKAGISDDQMRNPISPVSSLKNSSIDINEIKKQYVIDPHQEEAKEMLVVKPAEPVQKNIPIEVPTMPDATAIAKYNADLVALSRNENIHSEQREQRQILDNQFYAEAYDAEWAETVEQEFNTTFNSVALNNSNIVSADCRTSICRVVVDHTGLDAEQEFMRAFASTGKYINNGEQGLYQKEVDYNGTVKSVFYMARQGHSLPNPYQDH